MKAAIIRFLQWSRLCDEEGNVSLTHLFVILAAVVYFLHPDATTAATAAAAVANYAVSKKLLPFLKAKQEAALDDTDAARTHEKSLAEVSSNSKALEEQVRALAEHVQKLATPERLEAVKRMTGQQLNPAPRISRL